MLNIKPLELWEYLEIKQIKPQKIFDFCKMQTKIFKNHLINSLLYEEKLKAMEEKRADALEVAAKKNEKGEKEEKGQNMSKSLDKEKLDKYFSITKEALELARSNLSKETKTLDFKKLSEEFLDMAQRYFDDANHFCKKGDEITAFASLNYAHGWLDAGARLKLFNVKNSRLFAAD